jgi:hypothetical protein
MGDGWRRLIQKTPFIDLVLLPTENYLLLIVVFVQERIAGKADALVELDVQTFARRCVRASLQTHIVHLGASKSDRRTIFILPLAGSAYDSR